ncbi:MAG: hypothetical protein ABR536_05705 [Solirubrobacterales bacterium]
MRFVLRVLLFAAGFLIGGEALRRWLEKDEARTPAAGAGLDPVPQPVPPAAASKPAPEAAASAPRGEATAMSKAELYERAKALDIEGRSKMSKAVLAEAVARAEERA